MELLKQLSETAGIPGHEEPIRSIIRDALSGHVDTIDIDNLGNLIAHRKGAGPVVAIAAHMDEIGFIVSFIEEDSGFLRIHPLGGFDPKTLIAQRVLVHAKHGELIGCIGSKPVHIMSEEDRKKPVKLTDLFVDLGLSKEEVKKRVSVGDTITLRQEFLTYESVLSGKALDDRAGVYIAIEAIKRAEKIGCDLYFIGTTQEEVGLRGARVAGFTVKPQIGIALDSTIAADMPGVPGQEQVTRFGAGVAIKLTDSASISHPGLVQALRRLAEERKIPYQMEILPHGGTDAGALQMAQGGAAVTTLSLPTRYVHSVVEMAHQGDLEAMISLLKAFIEEAGSIELELP
ncbi:MAG: M42 family metallopeptidase [Candidatus Bipolaricaulota bacterium]|nr:M42 family metallopeptidase [Candidatus Bipolaricaulota bacterium]